ncbi:MAG TPA: peptide chain release factor-like protein [Verrucomicrobiota bacterium]|nr:peptide chain release factor-like protein [Verrucomicrobiota bacterium]
MNDSGGLSDDPLARRMAALGVREADLQETFVRSAGRGGQNVNKTSTCVVLLHRPTGIQVKVQITRHQGQNRLLARKLLLDRIEQSRRARAAAEKARLEKIRRRNRKPSAAARQRALADKRLHSQKKVLRRRVELE